MAAVPDAYWAAFPVCGGTRVLFSRQAATLTRVAGADAMLAFHSSAALPGRVLRRGAGSRGRPAGARLSLPAGVRDRSPAGALAGLPVSASMTLPAIRSNCWMTWSPLRTKAHSAGSASRGL
jgi:hypothetical protein